MPPRREPPDLCIIAILQMMTPNDQLKAAGISPRWAILVRAANRRVKLLVIANSNRFDGEETKDRVNCFSLASFPDMQLLPAGGEPFPDYPMITLSKWNCLLMNYNQLFDQATVEQIVNAFSAVIDLKLYDFCQNLIALLQHPQWANQLINLAVYDYEICYQPANRRLITAINALTALQCLALCFSGVAGLPALTIVAQLKVFTIYVHDHNDHFWTAFKLSLEHYAVSNVDLQLCLFGDFWMSRILTLTEPFRTRIVRFEIFDAEYYNYVPRFCRLFPSLTTLTVSKAPSQLGALFTALSTLHQLVRLKLEIVEMRELIFPVQREEENQLEEEQPPPPRPMSQLTTVRALTLDLHIRSHSQVQWFNLPVTLPRLQAIHIRSFHCKSCDVYLDRYFRSVYSENSKASTALACLRTCLPLLHPGVPHGRIVLGDRKPYFTLEQLLSTTQ